MVIPIVPSMPTAAIPIPYRPATLLATKMATQIPSTGRATLSRPTASPVIIFVPGPVWEASAIFLIGLPDV